MILMMGEKLSVESIACEDEDLVEEYKDLKGGKNRLSVTVRKEFNPFENCSKINSIGVHKKGKTAAGEGKQT